MPDDVAAILAGLEIQDFDEEIFSMSYYKLRKYFSYDNGGFYSSLCIKNLIWQDHGMILSGDLQPLHGNIRSYWYARVKPVLARARAKKYAKKYRMMIDIFVEMILNRRLFNYADFGFTDEGAHNRQLGELNPHIILVAEKVGHLPLLEEIKPDYENTIVALGGQPSALSSEYLVAEFQQAGLSLDAPIRLLTIVDYDPSGDSIAKSFIRHLKTLGFTGEITRVDLAHPSRMSEDRVRQHKYHLSSSSKNNRDWARKTGSLSDYGYRSIYGLEADAMTWEELTAVFDQEASPYLVVSRELVVQRRLKRELVEVLRELLLVRLGLG